MRLKLLKFVNIILTGILYISAGIALVCYFVKDDIDVKIYRIKKDDRNQRSEEG